MQITVGSALTIKGNNYICICIEKIDKYDLAKEDSATMKLWLLAGSNVSFIEKEIDEFIAGDIIHTTGERIQLECPGVDLKFIWTTFKVKKEEVKDAEQPGVEGGNGEGSDSQTQSIGSGDSSGEGLREESVGETSSSIHGHGSSGEIGDVVHPGNSEG